MSTRLRLKFADAMSASEFETAVELIQTCGMTIPSERPREFTVVVHPGELDVLKGFLATWRDDGLLSYADAT
jgi:hypothetical protein